MDRNPSHPSSRPSSSSSVPADGRAARPVAVQTQFGPTHRLELTAGDGSSPSTTAASHSHPAYPFGSYSSGSSSATTSSHPHHLASRPTSTSSTTSSLTHLASTLAHVQIPDGHDGQAYQPAASSSSYQHPPAQFAAGPPSSSSPNVNFQPPPQPGVTAPQKKKSHSKPKPAGHVPRPRNPFIMYRMDVVARGLITAEKKHQNISKLVSEMWAELAPEQKEPYITAARIEKEQHKLLHPNYIYQPVAEKPTNGKPPKRVSGSKASLKAAAAKEKKEREAELKRQRLQQLDEQQDDDEEYISSSTTASNKRSRQTARPTKSQSNTTSPYGSPTSSGRSASHDGEEDDDADFYPDVHARPMAPLRQSSSRGGPSELRPDSSSSFSSQGTSQSQWETSTDEGGDLQRMSMVDRGLHVGYPPSSRTGYDHFGGADEAGDTSSSDQHGQPSLRHYQAPQQHLQPHQQQPGYSYPDQQQQHYQPHDVTSYSTYSDYPMPPQLAQQSSSSSGLMPFNLAAHNGGPMPFRRHGIPNHAEFLPTSGPSPITPGFPSLHRRRGSSISSVRFAPREAHPSSYGASSGMGVDGDLFTPTTKAFLDSLPLPVTTSAPSSSSMGPPPTRNTPSAHHRELSNATATGDLFTHQPLDSSSSSRPHPNPNHPWHISNDPIFLPQQPAYTDYQSQQQQQQPTAPTYLSFPPPISAAAPSSQTSLNLSTRRKGRSQPLAIASSNSTKPSAVSSLDQGGATSKSSGDGDGRYEDEQPTPTQDMFRAAGAYAYGEGFDMKGLDQSWIPFDEGPWFGGAM